MNFGTKGCMYCEGKCTKECIIEEKSLKKEMEQIKCYCGHTTYCDCGPLEEKPESQSNTIYVVTAYRWGDIEQHGYVVGVYSSHENATNASKIEYINRGGKYECQITEHELNFIETYE